MAPLSKALNVQFAHKVVGPDPRTVYHGEVDPEWSIISLPHGGYILGLVLEASILHQAESNHPDPIHLTAHFLKSAVFGSFEVHVREIKIGKGFTNLTATFVQNGQDKIQTHIIFGVLSPTASSSGSRFLTLEPPAREATVIPMHTHVSKCTVGNYFRRPGYSDRICFGHDPFYADKAKEVQSGGMETGKWFTLVGKDEQLKPSMMPFLADSPVSLAAMIPHKFKKPGGEYWHPTLFLSVEFKFPIPKASTPGISQRTVALYSRGKFINDPSARHDTYVEVWTAPGDLGESTDPGNDDWRQQQRCLAVATQMAIVVPADVNRKNSTRDAKL